MNLENKYEYPAYVILLRGVTIFAFFLIIKFMCLFACVLANYSSGFPTWVQLLPCLIALPFIFNSILYVTTVYNKHERELFLSSGASKPTLKSELKSILTDKNFWIEYAVLSTLVVITSLLGGFFEFGLIIFPEAVQSFLIRNLFPIPVLLILFLLISLHRRYDAKLYWYQLRARGDLTRLENTVLLIPRILAIIFGYPLLFPSILYALLGIFSFVNIVLALVNVMTLLGFVLVIISIILFTMLILALNSIVLRHKLIKKLKAVAKSSGYKLSEIKRPYASMFRPREECNFTLEYQGKVFSCRLIGSWWQRAPLHFISKKHAIYLHKVGTRTHFFSYECHFNYGFEGEGDKLLIVCPMPRWLFASVDNTDKIITPQDMSTSAMMASYRYGGSIRQHSSFDISKRTSEYSRALEAGDKIWGYAIYNTTSFISAIDRKCLGRYNGLFE